MNYAEFLSNILASIISVFLALSIIILVKPYIDIPGGFERVVAIVAAAIPFLKSGWEKYLSSSGIDKKDLAKLSNNIKSIEDTINQLKNDFDWKRDGDKDAFDHKLNETEKQLLSAIAKVENSVLRTQMALGNSQLPELLEGNRITEKRIEDLEYKVKFLTQQVTDIKEHLSTKMG